MIEGETIAYLNEAFFRCSILRIGFWPYPQTLDYDAKALPGTNSLSKSYVCG